MNAAVADKLGGDAESLAAVRALVTLRFCVDASVVFECHQVGEFLLTGVAEIGAHLVAVLMVQKGAGVPVTAPALITDVRLAPRLVATLPKLLLLMPARAAAAGVVMRRVQLLEPVGIHSLGLH